MAVRDVIACAALTCSLLMMAAEVKIQRNATKENAAGSKKNSKMHTSVEGRHEITGRPKQKNKKW